MMLSQQARRLAVVFAVSMISCWYRIQCLSFTAAPTYKNRYTATTTHRSVPMWTTTVLRSSSSDDINIININNNKMDKNDGCPFTKRYKRYRVDVSVLPEKKGAKKVLGSVFRIPNFILRSSLEREYGPDNLVWSEQCDGIDAFSALWTGASSMLTAPDGNDKKTVALPDCDERILFNFVELMAWIEHNLPLPVHITATLLQDGGVDGRAVEFLRTIPNNSRDGGRVFNTDVSATPTAPVVYNKDTIDRRQQAWVQRMLVELGICPFTKSILKSGQGLRDLGVPVGKIAYHTSNATPVQIHTLMAGECTKVTRIVRIGRDEDNDNDDDDKDQDDDKDSHAVSIQ